MRWMVAMARESRGARGRLVFFTACIAIGVAAVVGVASLSGVLRQGLRSNSRDLLAADLVVESRRPLDDALVRMVTAAGATGTTSTREFASMVAPVGADGKAGNSRLARVKTVRGEFPFYGVLELDPPGTLAAALRDGVAVAAELGVGVGQQLRIGTQVLPVVAVVRKEPQEFGFMSMMGPRVYVHEDKLADSGLLGFGSRMRHQLLVRYPGADVDALAERVRAESMDAEHLSVETWRAGQPRLRQAILRVEDFLGLVALLSLVLGGIGVAQIAGAWIASRTPSIAILRCLGMRPREVLRLFLGQVVLLALAGSVIGAALGSLMPVAFGGLMADLIRPEVLEGTLFQPAAIARGIGLGVVIALLFSLPPLTAVWRVSPARVLRAEADPLPAPRLVRAVAVAVLVAGILGTAWVQSGRFAAGLVFTAGFFGLAGVLMLGARLVMSLAARLPRGRLHPYLAQGLAALARPGAGTTGGIVGLGLGVTVIVSMLIVEQEMSEGIETMIPADAPTVFLMDVQEDQWPGVKGEFERHGATGVQTAAIVMGRLRAVNGRSVHDLAAGRDGRARWTLTREQRLAPLPALPAGNTIVAGALWSDPAHQEVSLEAAYARDMGVELGDVLRFEVQGVGMDFKLTSLRSVEWRTFSLNFFVAVEPGSLDGAPGFRLAAAKVPPEREQALQDALAAGYANVSMIKVRAILEEVVRLFETLAVGVRTLGLFTVIAGLAILAGAISAAGMRRRREAALLKTLGATRKGVGVLFVTEYGLLGAVAGGLGAVGAVTLAWGFLAGVADLEFSWPLWTIPAATAAAALLAAGCGILASLRALQAPPRESLRA